VGLPDTTTLEGIMHHLRQVAYLLPFILAGLLLLNLVTAIADGGRASWLMVGFLALLLALLLVRRTRADGDERQPSMGQARSAPGELPATAPPRAPAASAPSSPSSKSRRWWFGRR
jgi:hypothetical protein